MTRSVLTIPGLDAVFFAAVHLRRWSLNIPLTPCSISSCSLVNNSFLVSLCLCQGVGVSGANVSHIMREIRSSLKLCISSRSHRWFAECVSATGWVDMLKQE